MLSNLFFQNLLRPFIYFVVVIAGPESLGILACDRCGILLQCLRLPSGESGCWGVLARVRQGPPAAQNARFLSRKHARARGRSLARLVEGEGKGQGREGLGWARTLHDFFSGTSRAQGWRLVGGKTVKNPSFRGFCVSRPLVRKHLAVADHSGCLEYDSLEFLRGFQLYLLVYRGDLSEKRFIWGCLI